MKPLPRLYAIADAAFGDPIQLAANLFNGGARLVQVRNKNGRPKELLQQVDRILSIAPKGAYVVVNDRVDVALITGTGVHLGQTDLPPVTARGLLGPMPMIGFSTHNLEQALEADTLPVDYVAVGPIFPTTTKKNPDPVVGVAVLETICKAIRKPVVAIGGISLENAKDVLNAGAASVAVIRDVLDSPNIAARVQTWMELLGAA